MRPKDDLTPQHPADLCENNAEIVIVCHHMYGMEGVEEYLTEAVRTFETREGLRGDAKRLRAVGLVDLADIVARYAKLAKRSPIISFAKRWGLKQRRVKARRSFQKRTLSEDLD
jgi:hypothetical protein